MYFLLPLGEIDYHHSNKPAMFNYHFAKPGHPLLAPYVDYFVQLDGAGTLFKSIYSRLNTSFLLDFDQGTFYDGQPVKTGLLGVKEKMIRFSPATCRSTLADKFFVSFTPYGLSVFTKMPMQELSNGMVAGEDIFGSSLHQLYDQLQPLSFSARVTLFETFLLRRFTAPHASHQLIFDLADDIKNDVQGSPFLQLKALPLSERQIERNFKRYIGTSISRFLRVARFEKAKQLIAGQPSRRLTDVAHLAGYFDQSHFISDFKRLTGVSPKNFRECCSSH
ncbi:helix-turn-helix domain-containing protein [Chitinophaga sp. Ak27]|uniref:helix-turn-helix domain-containing protein n=1 Tax=Chitinophaga sp. Ak27 TaxID=2726116 RepID=UPI00145C5003|nr:helix-turn-helix domain-containing protein [Chitinophaga sp. Ak27]NLU96011.1 AraC family transcriptional regulator [Chitinophaga sp. Ak27]